MTHGPERWPIWEVFATEAARKVGRWNGKLQETLSGCVVGTLRQPIDPVECGVGSPWNTHVVPVWQLTRI